MKIRTVLAFGLGLALLSSSLRSAEATTASPATHAPVGLVCPVPEYPVGLRKHSLVSEVIVSFVVDREGKVTKPRVTDALVGRFNANDVLARYVYNGSYAQGRFVVVPSNDPKGTPPKHAHLLPEAPVIEVGQLNTAPPYITTSQSDFGEQALKTISTWTYAPGAKDGQPIDSTVRVLVMFWRDGTASAATL